MMPPKSCDSTRVRRHIRSLLRSVNRAVRRSPSVVKNDLVVRLLWSDSVGAKSFCTLVQTPDVCLLIDPGASAMQPSFPLEIQDREWLQQKAFEQIERWSQTADVVVVTHYHHDHYASCQEHDAIYRGKLLLVKDPNQWINRSQWHRARELFSELATVYGGSSAKVRTRGPQLPAPYDPAALHPVAFRKDFGDYNDRRATILRKGQGRLEDLKRFWTTDVWLEEQDFVGTKVRFADSRLFRFGQTTLRFTQPLFHGIEYATVGWTLALVVETEGAKLLYSSDLQGPTIEDYTEWIIDERPDVAIIDGPPTYLFGQLVNRVNLQRAIDNAARIYTELRDATIVYDHHLPRDIRFRERMAPLFEKVKEKTGGHLTTLAELCGRKPLVLELAERSSRSKSSSEPA